MYITHAEVLEGFFYSWNGPTGKIQRHLQQGSELMVTRSGKGVYPLLDHVLQVQPIAGMFYPQYIKLHIGSQPATLQSVIPVCGVYEVSKEDGLAPDGPIRQDANGLLIPLRLGEVVYAVSGRMGRLLLISQSGLPVTRTRRLKAWVKALAPRKGAQRV